MADFEQTSSANNKQPNKYLKLARRAREENNAEDAKRFYDMVRTDDPDCAEARFFYAYYKLIDGKNREIYSQYCDLCNVVSPVLRAIAESGDDMPDKEALIKDIFAHMKDLPLLVNKALNNLNKNANSAYSSDISGCCKASIKMFYNFGDTVEKHFSAYPSVMKIGADAWIEGVASQQKWYGVGVDKSLPEIYTAKIKKYYPNYETPKKAGCISFG